MDEKLTKDLFFYYTNLPAMKSIFKDMVTISQWNDYGMIKNKKVRRLAIQELSLIEGILNREEPLRDEYLKIWAQRILKPSRAKHFQIEKDLLEYYEYIQQMVKPTENELFMEGIYSSFFYFKYGEYGTIELNRITNTNQFENNSLKKTKEIRAIAIKELKIVNDANSAKSYNQPQLSAAWDFRIKGTVFENYFSKNEHTILYENHLFKGIKPTNTEVKKFKLNTPLDSGLEERLPSTFGDIKSTYRPPNDMPF